MKPNQTSVRGGIQDILLPMEYFRCFQGDFEGNHPSYACDMSGRDTGRDLFYAPVDVKCVDINDNDGNTVWWESIDKVRFADGTIDYLTMMIIHDNNLNGIYVGVTYNQGTQIAQEGTKGFTIGNHLHVEFAKGKFTKRYAKNVKGYYLPNSIAIETVCFADDTIFVTSKHWNWKKTSDVPIGSSHTNKMDILNEIPDDFVKETGTFYCKVDKIKIRKAPSLDGELTGYYYEDGASVHYDGYVKRDGYVWISWISVNDETRRWMAVREITSGKAFGQFC